MQIIEKWKTRETKKKLREENIRLKAEIEVNMKTPYPVCTVGRNIHKICAKHRITKWKEVFRRRL